MNPAEYLKKFKDRVFSGQLVPGDYATIGLGGLLGAHLLRSAKTSAEQPPVIMTPAAVDAYGRTVSQGQNPATVGILTSPEGGSTSVTVPMLDEEEISRQKRYLSSRIATNLVTLRQLEKMQQQYEVA